MDGCTGKMRKNLIKQEANRRDDSTRAASTVRAHNSNSPGMCRENKARSWCPFLITTRQGWKRTALLCSDEKQITDLEEGKEGKEEYQGTTSKEINHCLHLLFLKQNSTSVSGRRLLFVHRNNVNPE